MSGVAVDTSALVAILEGEPECDAFIDVITTAARAVVGTGTLIEASLVVARRRGEGGLVALDALVSRLRVEPLPMTVEHVTLARDAWLRFGKGRHPAGLNLGDCLSYALARSTGFPLLCKGEDFPRTDLALARIG